MVPLIKAFVIKRFSGWYVCFGRPDLVLVDAVGPLAKKAEANKALQRIKAGATTMKVMRRIAKAYQRMVDLREI